MKMSRWVFAMFLTYGAVVTCAMAAEHKKLTSPASGVVCDIYFCADAKGISDALTTRFLGNTRGEKLKAQGMFDRTAFTFANGIYCDVKEKVCRKDRYFGTDGKPSGAIEKNTTRLLFEVQ